MGKLLVIDGLDGSGKATQAKLLQQNLEKLGYKVVKISFPNYDSLSSSLVKMYLKGEFGSNPNDVPAYAASSFYAVDRFASFKTNWEKDYNSDCIILADRYVSSNQIYQMTKIKKEEWDEFINWSNDYEFNKLLLPQPNGVIYLDMLPEISQKLMNDRYSGDQSKKDIHECNVEFLTECRNTAMYAAKKSNWDVIKCFKDDSPKSIEEIQKEILSLSLKILA